ncbi:LTA synthase family protein [Clostridium vitabionis]|uniref:LTA synthase family protein n=1 Tax=Clostridium vitabionis TaxID=2784388 RepID=UPI00188ADDB4|nr:LTA synthase family protein [Clostridium vitabionis]
MMAFVKTRKKELIRGILLILVISAAVMALALVSYPRMTFDRSALYGAQNENLKDFSENDGAITAESKDPWIAVPIGQKLGVYSVRIYVSDMTGQNCAYIYVSNSEGWFDQYRFLKNGMDEINFRFQVLPAETNYIRLDVTDVPGNSMRVDYVVINSWRSVISGVFRELVRFWLAAGLIYVLFNRWRAQKNSREDGGKDGRKIPALALICSAILIAAWLGLTIRDYSFVGTVDDPEMLWGAYFGGAAALLCLERRGKYEGLFRHGAVWLFAAFNFCLIELLCPTAFTEISAGGVFLNIAILAAGYYLAAIFFPESRLIFLLPNGLYLLLGLVNHYYDLYRGQLFEYSDIQFAGTAAKVADHYRFAVDGAVLCVLLAEAAVLTVVCLLAYRDFEKFALRLYLRRRLAALAGAGLTCLLAYSSLTPVSLWNNDESAAEYGYIRSFLSYAKMSLERPVPAGYDENAVKEKLASYAGGGMNNEKQDSHSGSGTETEEPAQNVIVLMNEAFSDLPAVYGFETNTDGMPFIHSLSGANVRKGIMMPSVFGGGTADTEYEFLTGNSVAFLNAGSAPYTQYINSSRPSMASELAADGYRTVAFHPEHESNYKRNKVYPLLGFQNFLSIEDELTYTDTVRNFVSDAADVKNVEEIYQQSQGEPTFIFNVTMQNHGGYSQDKSAVDVTVYPTDERLQNPELEEYLSLVRLTDSAFEDLVGYFSNVPEKTIILMFGDHQPGLSDSVYDLLDPNLTGDAVSAEYLEEKYQVPYIVWANYDLDEPEVPRISPGFLHSLFLDYADIAMSCYDRQIYECMQSWPAVNALGCYNADGQYFPTSQVDADEVLSDYRKSAYYSLFGKKMEWGYFQ